MAGIQGVIDNELNRIMIATANQVIWGQLNEPLTAAISFSGGCTIDPLSSVEQSFKLNSVVYTVTSGDGALIRRYVVRLVFDEFGGGDDPPVVVPPVLDKVNHFAYMVGYPGGYVRPELPISRAETVTIFFRLLTQEHRAGAWKTANGFADTDSAAWYNNAVSTLSGMGVLKGYADGSFAPGASITRAEFAAIAVRFADMANISGSANPGGFTDISGHWAEAEIIRAAQLGYVRGDGNGLFRPDEFITRAEVVTMINRVLDRHVNDAADLLPGMMVWPDNTEGAWYYFDVQEATNSHYYTRKTDGINEKWTELRTAPDWTLLERPGAKPSDVSY